MINYGWDKEYGGIYYFMDRKGCLPNNWSGIRNFGGYTLKHLFPY